MRKWLKSAKFVKFEVKDRVATVTLNRPEKRNALSREMLTELRQAMLEADDLNDVHCIVLQAEGRDFCSGYDLVTNYETAGANTVDGPAWDASLYRGSGGSFDDDIWRIERNQADLMTILDIHKPVIAKVHGHCVAGGTDLMLMCDLVVVADDARIGFPAVRSQGSPPTHLWTYLVGPQWAKRLLLTGDLLLGTDAERIGLALKAVPAAQLDQEVDYLAQRMALIDPDILTCNKRIVNLSVELMGGRTIQRLAAENDVRGHQARSNKEFLKRFAEDGFSSAVRSRDAAFGDGLVR
jgi:enoyl-CoA hydratase